MNIAAQDDFRLTLRQATRDHHDQLDRHISTLDLGTGAGLSRFCAIHAACFGAMARATGDGRVAMLAAALEQDHVALTGQKSGVAVRPPSGIHPLAQAYIVEGSRLGTRVLQKHWEDSKDPAVKAASAYFSLPHEPDRWAQVCADLRAIPAASQQARQISRDSCQLFDMFLETFHHTG